MQNLKSQLRTWILTGPQAIRMHDKAWEARLQSRVGTTLEIISSTTEVLHFQSQL